METKKCTKCGREKSVDQFGKRTGGYQSWCKACTNEAVKSRNKEHYHEDHEYRHEILDNKAKMSQEKRAQAAFAKARARSEQDKYR